MSAPEPSLPHFAINLTVRRVADSFVIPARLSGTAKDSEETVKFSQAQDITCQIEKYGLEDAEEAYQSMVSGNVRFRAVLVPGYKK